MNTQSSITDIIRNNAGERLKSIKVVPFSIGTQDCTMLKRCLYMYVFVSVYNIFTMIEGWFWTF